jgi:monoamine oxidase
MATGASDRADVAIIGAGVGGLYGAARLSQIAPQLRVHVYDASNRLGGRLNSLPLEHERDNVIESGGAFFSDKHENVFGLVNRLGLDMIPVIWRRQNYFLRGRLLTEAAFADPDAVPYRLRRDEQGKSPCDLAIHAFSQIIPNFTEIWPFAQTGPAGTVEAAASYLRKLEVHGRPLPDWDLRHLLDLTISQEAIALLSDTLGSMAALRGNAYNAISTLLWEINPAQRHYMLRDGYRQLPLALKRACEASVQFFLGRKLKRLVRLSDGIRLHFETPSGERLVEARAVILALPKRALEAVNLDDALVDEQFYRDLSAVSTVPACKLFLVFEKAWWGAQATPCSGDAREIEASYADLPIRQCWFFQHSANGLAVMMAAFADAEAVGFWSELVNPSYRDRRPRPWLNGGDDPSNRASTAMIEAARRQLQLLHPDLLVAEPCGALFLDWSDEGAWHAWNPYARSWEVRHRVRRPNANSPFYVCSDAFAQSGGWVESTINNMEALIEEHFGAPRPDWVRGDYSFEF